MDDGWPLDFILPGTYRDHLIPNIVPDNDSNEWPSTLWYHDHTIDYTASNVYRGLAGMSLHFDTLDSGNENDTNPAALRLPSGAYDVPLVFRDVALNADGSLLFNQLDTKGQVGNLKTVNGKVKPFLKVQRRKYRFRLLAGSMAREWMFRIWKGTTRIPFKIIASDGGLLPAPVQVTQHQMGNAERYEIIVDFTSFPAGTQITLNDHIMQSDGNKPLGVSPTGDPLVLFVVEGAAPAPDPSRVPAVLRPLSPVDMTRVVATRSLELSQVGGIWTINGLPWNPNVPLFQPKLGSAEIWNVSVKGGGWDHPLHIHQEFFRILKRGGSTPQPWERGRKDVVLLSNTSACQLYVQFRTFTGPYVFHCHNLGHEDMAMMGWYNVIP
jgi:FtsP/CotA-like multicopper oxidase with cupredoxin domain